jgi:hypothetical protein
MKKALPLGVRALGVSGVVAGVGLAFCSYCAFIYQRDGLAASILSAVGILSLLCGIGFLYRKKWAWWWAVINSLALGLCMLVASAVDLAHFQETGDCCGPDKKIAGLCVSFIFWPFLCYYLLRTQTRTAFGVGGRHNRRQSTPASV